MQVQVVNNNPKDTDIFFKVYCPGQYDKTPHKEIMYQNGSVSNNIRYLDICVEKFIINVAFNQEPGWFELNWHGLVNTMVKYGMSHGKFVGTERFISQNHEILCCKDICITSPPKCYPKYAWFERLELSRYDR